MVNGIASSLAGRHAVVTGAARGIGAAIARRLAADGARLTLLGRQEGPLQELAAELPASAQAQAIVCDIADPAAVGLAFGKISGGTAHILVNNAGQAASAPFGRTSDELWQRMLAVNLTGTFLCARAALPGMLAAGWGRIVNTSSTAGQRGYAYVSAYAAAKHGVVGPTRSLALEVASKGITVNAVCPGYTETDLLRESVNNVVAKTGRGAEEARAEFARTIHKDGSSSPRKSRAPSSGLCSSGASAIDGQSISVSGGEVM
jgi:NAD(P)-dependent dehydrogenase (short-subunit alcohol dehydrogenase family)